MIVDDGWVYGYNDYSLAALQKIKYGLKPKLEKEIDLMAEGASLLSFFRNILDLKIEWMN